jgi:hypothetical protein
MKTNIKNKKFWEELTAYSSLIRQAQHRKRRVQQLLRKLKLIDYLHNTKTTERAEISDRKLTA